MPRTHRHTAPTFTPASLLRDRCLLAAACAAICGWALSLAWLWMA